MSPLYHHDDDDGHHNHHHCHERDGQLSIYRTLLADMANTCRTLQARIRGLEADLTMAKLHGYEMGNNSSGRRFRHVGDASPTSSADGDPLNLRLRFSPSSAQSQQHHLGQGRSGSQISNWDKASRRHSAPPGSLHRRMPSIEEHRRSNFKVEREPAIEDGHSSGGEEEVVWVLYDDTARLEKSWLWF